MAYFEPAQRLAHEVSWRARGVKMSRSSIAGLLLLSAGVLFAGPACAQDPTGDYSVTGRGDDGVAYVGSATIRWTAEGLELTLTRGDAPELRGPLDAERGFWVFEATSGARGMTRALERVFAGNRLADSGVRRPLSSTIR